MSKDLKAIARIAAVAGFLIFGIPGTAFLTDASHDNYTPNAAHPQPNQELTSVTKNSAVRRVGESQPDKGAKTAPNSGENRQSVFVLGPIRAVVQFFVHYEHFFVSVGTAAIAGLTGVLAWATIRLVKDAQINARRQLRAYIQVVSATVKKIGPKENLLIHHPQPHLRHTNHEFC